VSDTFLVEKGSVSCPKIGLHNLSVKWT
jgi:hypothetical protein